MKNPGVTNDERERLETLQSLHILDTPGEERFDRLTRMAKRLFDVPIALVSIIDENRQWFKSCSGLSISETARDISFCGHAILGDGLFVIPDTAEDERFADNPLVLNEPFIRFYAGCPLRAPNGHKLGTLCVIDRRPRNFTSEDEEALIDLAAMVEREIAALQLAMLDELTGISNRRGFFILAERSLKICARQKLRASLVSMDLDNLKPVNDKFGHAEGDRALKVFAKQMKSACRNSDILARMGGDEFAMLLIDAPQERAENVVARLRESLEKYNQEAQRGYDISFSHGIAGFNPQKPSSIEAMLVNGDALMYTAKKSKYNTDEQ